MCSVVINVCINKIRVHILYSHSNTFALETNIKIKFIGLAEYNEI